MSEETLTAPVETPVEEIIAVPVIEEPPAPVEEPEQTYVYQPTDETGRPLGGKQVIKYRTHDELVQKMTDQNIQLVRKLREQTRKQRLGISSTDTIPDTAPRFDAPVEFSPQALTAEDRIQLSRDLLDPEKVEEANSRLFEANVGAKPETVRNALSKLQADNLRLMAKVESDAFVRMTPDYFGCKENFETVTNWMMKNDLLPERGNFKLAYDTLRADGLLLEKPIEVEPVLAPVPVQVIAPVEVPATPPPAPAPVEKPASRIGTGLNRSNTVDAPAASRSVADDIVYDFPVRDRVGKLTGEFVRYTGIAAVDKMPADEFRRRAVSDRTFNQRYEKLVHEDEQRRSRR